MEMSVSSICVTWSKLMTRWPIRNKVAIYRSFHERFHGYSVLSFGSFSACFASAAASVSSVPSSALSVG
jgi:hypothetical protein